MQSYVSQLDNLVGAINAVASNKNYWLIRTQAGALYQTFIDNSYISIGHKELGASKLPEILKMKYGTAADGIKNLGGLEVAKNTYYDFQRCLYAL